ncbi:CesT family type III secretion system chaperone [Aeromonas salmonicida]|uniref:CesT family type III secretion system chaperone n=1 Tax=Aeromonas salmonicida TaxID=645 RepID=UPI00232E8AEE|nr:CesT family type III secretion system chaperone [Aeromonas salmonicida]WCH23621.1 type III secretion system chaperone [Aeromonas salmonicida]
MDATIINRLLVEFATKYGLPLLILTREGGQHSILTSACRSPSFWYPNGSILVMQVDVAVQPHQVIEVIFRQLNSFNRSPERFNFRFNFDKKSLTLQRNRQISACKIRLRISASPATSSGAAIQLI